MPIITNEQTKQQVSLGEHTVPISSEYSNTAFPQLFQAEQYQQKGSRASHSRLF